MADRSKPVLYRCDWDWVILAVMFNVVQVAYVQQLSWIATTWLSAPTLVWGAASRTALAAEASPSSGTRTASWSRLTTTKIVTRSRDLTSTSRKWSGRMVESTLVRLYAEMRKSSQQQSHSISSVSTCTKLRPPASATFSSVITESKQSFYRTTRNPTLQSSSATCIRIAHFQWISVHVKKPNCLVISVL